jgi:two-component system, sensor histidine kinase PdtaS
MLKLDLKNRVLLVAVNIVIILGIGIVDYITTSKVRIIALYLIPIFITSYFVRMRWGVLFSTMAVAFIVIIEYIEISTLNLYILVNSIMLLAVYIVVVYLTCKFRDNNRLIQKNLSEKEMIIRDIHHRMKNQMSSLLSLVNLGNSTDPGSVISRVSGRIHTHLLLYEHLSYDRRSQASVNVYGYLNEIAGYIVKTMVSEPMHIDVAVRGGDFFLNNKTVIDMGLIVNELMTNSMKYAFTGRPGGSIEIEVTTQARDQLVLSYRDDGPGFEYSPEETEHSLGLMIIRALTGQLNGTIDYSNAGGSRYTITLSGVAATPS